MNGVPTPKHTKQRHSGEMDGVCFPAKPKASGEVGGFHNTTVAFTEKMVPIWFWKRGDVFYMVLLNATMASAQKRIFATWF